MRAMDESTLAALVEVIVDTMASRMWIEYSQMEIWRMAYDYAAYFGIQFERHKLGDDPDGLDPIIRQIVDGARALRDRRRLAV